MTVWFSFILELFFPYTRLLFLSCELAVYFEHSLFQPLFCHDNSSGRTQGDTIPVTKFYINRYPNNFCCIILINTFFHSSLRVVRVLAYSLFPSTRDATSMHSIKKIPGGKISHVKYNSSIYSLINASWSSGYFSSCLVLCYSFLPLSG